MKTVLEKKIVPYTSLKFLRTLHFFTTRLFGTGFGVASKLLMPLVRTKDMELQYGDGSKFTFKLNDGYWNRLAIKDYVYEQEIEYFLHKVRIIDYIFLDCGANYGYWSVLVSSELLGSKEVIAIEASPTTYDLLSKNCRVNDSRFIILNNALASESGRKFFIDSSENHAAASVQDVASTRSSVVESSTLDHIYGKYAKDRKLPVIIKLDVEGQEINALVGAKELVENDVLIVYEDHAQDAGHTVTSFVLSELKMSVFYIDENNDIVEIMQTEMLGKIKIIETKGYNFFACKKDSCFMSYLSGV